MLPDRWEHGSEFHWPTFPPATGGALSVWGQGQLYGSGRDALRAIVRFGRQKLAWRRFWLPAYLCQDVAAAIICEGLEAIIYPDLPGTPLQLPEAVPGDTILVVNTFGLRTGPSPKLPEGVTLIEDHTHDPWSSWVNCSTADYCVVSLRKTLPLPDGGGLWSPAGLSLPKTIAVTSIREKASSLKLAALLLKALYLAGHAVDKQEFRRLACAGEEGIANGDISAMPESTRALISLFPARSWRESRQRNFHVLSLALAGVRGVRILQPESDECVPFAVVLVADSHELRERLRTGLIEHSVYPAVLWPLGAADLGLPAMAGKLSRRVLALHCDQRYTVQDLARVAGYVADLTGS